MTLCHGPFKLYGFQTKEYSNEQLSEAAEKQDERQQLSFKFSLQV